MPTANSNGSAGTIAPRTMTASQNAMAKITAPAATGCVVIQASRFSNQEGFIAADYRRLQCRRWAGTYGLNCGHESRALRAVKGKG